MSQVVSILSKKGGVGKTTTSLNLAADIVIRGHSAVVLDADVGNDSATVWCEANGGKYFPVMSAPDTALERTVHSLKSAFDYIIIDGSPKADSDIGAAIKCSDLVVIVCGASLLDVVRNEAIAVLVSEIDKNLERYTPCKWLLTRCVKNTKVLNKAIEKITESRIPKIFSNGTTELTAYKEVFFCAETIFDATGGISNIEKCREQTRKITTEFIEVINNENQ